MLLGLVLKVSSAGHESYGDCQEPPHVAAVVQVGSELSNEHHPQYGNAVWKGDGLSMYIHKFIHSNSYNVIS